MIQSKEDLRRYIRDDNAPYLSQMKWGGLVDRILCNEKYFIYRFKVHLRKVEYYRNVRHGVLGKALYLYHFLRYKRLSWKLKLVIFPNTVGPGLHFYHIGSFIHIGKHCRIGSNFTFPGGVLLGAGKGGVCQVTVGDNCYMGLNTTVLGKVNIGNNVTIGAHSLVLDDIPDNCVAVGAPARVIKHKTE